MKGRKRLWKRADCRIRLFCRLLTERQRICLLALLFLLLLAGCIHAIGSPLRRSERGGGSRLEPGRIRAPELIQEKEKWTFNPIL